MIARCNCAWVISVGRTWMRSNAVMISSPPDGLKFQVCEVCTTGENIDQLAGLVRRSVPVVGVACPGAVTEYEARPSRAKPDCQVAVKNEPACVIAIADDAVAPATVV